MPRLGLSSGTLGAFHELKVALDLYERGFEVFRSLSPAASCDLVIRNRATGKLMSVEVRAGPGVAKPERADYLRKLLSRCDFVAVILIDAIYYLPKAPEA